MVVEPLPQIDQELQTGRELTRAGQITHAVRVLEALPLDDLAPDVAAVALAALLECRLARGELTLAGRTGDRLLPGAAAPGTPGGVALYALGELATARGEHDAARGRYTDAGARLDIDDPDTVPWRSGAALALTRLGEHRSAAVLAVEHLGLALATGSPYAVAHALRTVAATNADGNRLRLLREARAALADARADRLAAQIDTDLAALLVLHGTATAEAVVLLRAAEEYAGREDLFPLQQRVRALLERLGEHPRRIRSESLASLTATEQKAARLAADGLTNREIAAQLRVTVKAVEWHLSHVYRKLGIRSRTNLPESLGVPA